MDILNDTVFRALGNIFIPFILIYFGTKSSPTKIESALQIFFAVAIAWCLQIFVLVMFSRDIVISVPAAFFVSYIAIVHVNIISAALGKANPSENVRYGWFSFYWRLLVLYLPSLVASALVLLFLIGNQHSALVGTLAQIPASIYAVYFCFKWYQSRQTSNLTIGSA